MSRGLPVLLRRAWVYWTKRPAPAALVAAWLSLRWRCRVSPAARIDWPGHLRIGRGARLYGCRIVAHGRIDIGAGCEVQDYAILDTQLNGRIELGDGTAIGPFTILYGAGGVVLGKACSIAGHSMIVSSTHTTDERGVPIRAQGYAAREIRIEDDVWLGANCTVLPGAVIGRGSIVGANSLVRGDIPPYGVAVGSPAKVIRER